MPNRFVPIPGGTDPAQQLAIINKNFGELDNESVKKLYDDSTGTHNILIDASTSVIKIAKTGYDVTTATNDQLAFNSAQDVFKIVLTGTTTMAVSFSSHGASSSGQDTTTAVLVDYSSLALANPPGVMLFINNGGNYSPIATGSVWLSTFTANSWLNQHFRISANAGTMSLNFRQDWGTGVGGAIAAVSGLSFDIRYYILQETAN